MKWELLLAGPARKALKRIPAADQRRILAIFDAMEQDPFSGDIVRLKAARRLATPRRRLANSLRHRTRKTARSGSRRREADLDDILITWSLAFAKYGPILYRCPYQMRGHDD